MNVLMALRDFKEGLAREKISQVKFAERFYKDIVNSDASDEELEKHMDRFKKLIQKETHKAPELLFSYIHFFDERYGVNGKYSKGDREAAWNMYVELDTRIATRKLEHGQSKAAVASLAQLFTKHREFSQQAGPHCRKYYLIVTDVFESTLRPFTSKWHQRFESADILSDEKDKEFRRELVSIQEKLTALKVELLDMSQQ